MKIQQLHLNRYGPPLASGLDVNMDDFTLVWGNNEDGKTLAIEALLKLFYGSGASSSIFNHIDRVDEQPEGYVVLEGREGEEHKISGDETLEDLLDVSPRECRNVFVIRDGDLSMSEQGEFFTSVTDRLTGLRTSEIEELREQIIDQARLKPSGTGYSNRQEDDKLQNRVEDARELVEEIEELEDEVEEEALDELEERRVRLKEELQRIEEDIESQEAAEKRERYERARRALDELQDARGKISELSDFTREKWQQWRDSRRQAGQLEEAIEDLEGELDEKEDELEALTDERKEQEQRVRTLSERWNRIEDEVKPELRALQEDRSRLAKWEPLGRVIRPGSYVSAALLALSLLALLISPSVVTMGACAVLLASAIAAWGCRWWLASKRAETEGRLQAVRQALAENDLEGGELEEMLRSVEEFKSTVEREKERLQNLKVKEETLENTVQDLEESQIPDREEKLKQARQAVEEVRRESGVESLEEFADRLEERNEQRKRADARKASLESLLGSGGETEDEQLDSWRQKVAELQAHSERASDVDYDEDRLAELKQRREELNEELEESSDELADFQKKLDHIERRACQTLPGGTGDLLCRASSDLQQVRERLQEFLDEARLTREAGEGVVSVLEELNREEREQISELFGPDSRAARHFHEASGGAYEGLEYDQEDGSIMVTGGDGLNLRASELSGGAYDQLYLSIRLAIGEQLLGGETGFFILDDPFVRADPDRLSRQMDMLRELNDRGWQVIYFSAKGEVRDLLKPDIESGDVNLQALSNRQLGGG